VGIKTLATPKSSNGKLAGKTPVASTQRSSDSCPPSCGFNKEQEDGTFKPACYAASGPGGGVFALVKRFGESDTKHQLGRIAEGALTNSVVRHLVSGDVDPEYMEVANWLHQVRPDLTGYGYTHKWRELWLTPDLAEGWTLNASCETEADVHEALAFGWQVVIESPAEDLWEGRRIDNRKVVGCPAQKSEKVKCSDCMLCRTDSSTRPIVEFTLHGGSINANSNMLTMKRMES
jgi:hypothetical protein